LQPAAICDSATMDGWGAVPRARLHAKKRPVGEDGPSQISDQTTRPVATTGPWMRPERDLRGNHPTVTVHAPARARPASTRLGTEKRA
jgi:hypothetical protein